jgi:hypothetical protein
MGWHEENARIVVTLAVTRLILKDKAKAVVGRSVISARESWGIHNPVIR